MANLFSNILKLSDNKQKALEKPYNYYASVKEKTNRLYEKHNLSKYTYNPNKQFYRLPMDDDIAREIFYNFNLNMCNQIIYNHSQGFTENDLYFIAEFRIENIMEDIIETFTKDIIKMKERENTNKNRNYNNC